MGERTKPWWDKVPLHAGGDVIVGTVGAGARNVAIGKGITQAVYDVLGEPTPDDKRIVEQRLAGVASALEGRAGQVDPATASMASFQLEVLKGELSKTEPSETPSGTTITKIGDWLLDNVPEIGGSLVGLFATPAVGKVVGKAGELAVAWVKQRFGGEGGAS